MKNQRWLTLFIVASALFMICVDMTVLYTALPVLTHALKANAAERLWIVNVYSLVVAGLLPGLGTLGDRYGHRRLFIAGLLLFGLASLAAAAATTPALLIGARVLLGVAGATMMPATLAIIREQFEDERERAMAIGWWAGIAGGGLALGPVIGGLLLAHFDWGAVFLINLPVVALTLLLTWLYLPARPPRGGQAWDGIGSLQVMIGLFGVVYAIKTCADRPFALPPLLLSLAVGSAGLWLFARRQARQPQPLIDFKLFALPGFAVATAGAMVGTAGIVGVELVLGQHLQLVLDLTPLQAGLFILPAPLGGLLGGPLGGWLLRHAPSNRVSAGALLLAALAALSLQTLPLDGQQTWQWVLLLVLMGTGVGASATASATAIMSGAPPQRAGMAAAIEEVSFELGGTLGVAVFGSLMTIAYAYTLNLPAALQGLPAVVHESIDDALRVMADLSPAQAAVLRDLADNAFTHALVAVLWGTALVWAGMALCLWRASGRQAPQRGVESRFT